MASLLTNILAFITGQWSLISPDWRDPASHDPSWYRYVRASKSKTIFPARVLPDLTRGDVANPSGLVTGEGGPTILTRLSESDEIPSVTVDFGQNTVGIVSISFAGSGTPDGAGDAARPGIRLAFSETLQFLSNVSDFSRSYNGDTITPGSEQIAVRSEPYVWTAQHGCQYPGDGGGKGKVCVDGLHGFRYLRIYLDALPSDAPYTAPRGQVKIASVSLALSAFHGMPETFRGWFECSDRELTRWWFDGVYTNDLCIDTFRAEDIEPRDADSEFLEGRLVIHDAPKRDRDPNNYTLPLFDYPLWWVVCSHDYVWYTGDVGYLETYYQNLLAVMDKWYPSVTNPDTGLVTKGLNGTGGYGDYAFLPRQGPVTYYNALWKSRGDDVAKALAQRNFDESVGAFYDGTTGADSDSYVAAHAQDGNSIAILADVVSGDKAKGVLAYYARAASRAYGNAFYDSDAVGQGFSQRVYAFVSYFELAARLKDGDGRAEGAVEEMKRLYGWMGGQDPGVTFWEGIGPDGRPYEDGYTSMAHGWSTGIVPLMSSYVLGVKPTSPGFKTWSVMPGVGGEWVDEGGGRFKIAVLAERGTKGVVGVPFEEGMVVEVDERVVFSGRVKEGRVEGKRVVVDVEGKGWETRTVVTVTALSEGL
uniref:Alpha-l-rhamnosidase n=1 Tax=Colletotrichum fructicola (strain Nara gc5) TaxID=1213859 RepID=L2G8X7_COLFN